MFSCSSSGSPCAAAAAFESMNIVISKHSDLPVTAVAVACKQTKMAERFVVDLCEDKENAVPASANLQEAFRKFRKERQVHSISILVQSCSARVAVEVCGSRSSAVTS